MATIDELDIQISVQVNRAMASLNALSRQLNTVGEDLNRIGTSSGGGFSRLGTAARKINDSFSQLSLNVNKSNYSIKKITNNSNSFSGSLKNLTKGLVSVATLAKGFKALGESIKEATGYIEDYNYYTVAFGKIASEWGNDFEKYGYSSAQDYSDCFIKRMNDTLGKLSGVKIELDAEGKGLLSESGMKNLGLNIRETTQYAAQLASVTNSLGMTGEASLAASKAMTALAGDISSLFNISYKSAAQNLQSGLIGQSRALYKYGIDITNATLQTYAYKLGLEKAVKEMTQAEKMQLRLIAILDQSNVSWGDLANTINSPANMIRQMSNNFKELSMIIGQMFIPILQKILPVINGVLIAAKRLAVFIAGLIGIKLDFSAFGQGYSDIGDGLEDVSDGYDDATKSAKKFNKQLRAFDELNTISLKNESGSGSGGTGGGIDMTDDILKAVAEYEKAWQKAFDKMENDAEKIADKIQKVLKDVWKPIGKAWAAEGKYVQRAWTEALKNIGSLAVTVGKDIMKVWKQDATVEIFKDIFHIIGDIGQVVANLAENFEKAWKKYETGLHILEGIRDIFGIIVKSVREMSEATVYWSATLDFTPLLSRINGYIQSLKPVMESLSGIVSDFYTQVLLPLGKWTIEKGLPDLINVFTDFNYKVDWEGLRSNLSEFWKHLEPFAETVGEGLIIFINDLAQALAGFINSEAFKGFLTMIENWMDSVDPDEVANGLKTICGAIVGFKVVETAAAGLTKAMTFLAIWRVGTGTAIAGEMTAAAGGVSTLAAAFSTLAMHAAAVAIAVPLAVKVSKPIVELSKNENNNGSVRWFKDYEEKGPFGIMKEDIDDFLNKVTDFESAMETVNEGFILTDEQLKSLHESGKLSNEDIDTLVDCMLELNPELSAAREEFDLWDEYPQTISDISKGMGLIKDGTVDAKNAFDEFNKPMWNMTDNAKKFFLDMQNMSKENTDMTNTFSKNSESISGGLTTINDSMVPLSASIDDTKESFNSFGEEVADMCKNDIEPVFSLDKWNTMLENVKTAFDTKWGELKAWWQESTLCQWWEEDVTPWFTVEKWSETLQNIATAFSDKWNEIVEWWNGTAIVNWWNNDVTPWFTKEKWIEAMSGIKEAFKSTWNAAISSIKTIWNTFASWLNEKLTWTIDPVVVMGTTVFEGTTINLGRIPTFQAGGYPEDGLFMANHGELVGKFSNGKTAVANNEQITQGIAQAIYPAVYNAVSSALAKNRGNGSEPIINVYIDSDTIGQTAVKYIQGEEKRLQKSLVGVY